ncbi:hypothetical protein OSB04_006702 [Centaurea solstitialis]|uniref:Uncharacterized protein n=1 Tax=Centaurea solstitialis TaxID=347529 RepID=A0AA38WHX1_9ASTR|nr:hypothetical protein OSB04_006702 [Centaurea solstitialis]
MELFLSGSDPQIPYFLEHGPHVPTHTIHAVPAANGQPAIPARELVKPVTDWNDEDRHLVSIDTKARSLIAMSLSDDVFHSVCHLRSIKEIWNTLCIQYEGTSVLMESRKIHLVRQFESFIHLKDETLSQIHQRFNCLLIDLKTIGNIYSNSEVITKFMEVLPKHWEIYTTCLTMSKDIKTLTLSELYGILLNREQQKKLKKNFVRDTKGSKSSSLALVSDSVTLVATPSSLVTITELESSDSDISESDPNFNESIAFLTHTFKMFAKKGNFQRRKPLTLTDKPKTESFAPSSTNSSSKNPKYQRLKDKYKKMKSQRKGKGLIAEDCDWDDVSSNESSDEEDTQVALTAIIEEPTLALMAKIEEVPEEAPAQAPEASTTATESSKNYKDQVSVNQTLCIEREKALAAKERALAELNAEKVTIKGWSDASEKILSPGSLAKPPRFNVDNFPLWKSRMELFLSGSDPQIPYFLEHGPCVPTSIVPAVAATSTTPTAPERTFVKQIHLIRPYEKFIATKGETLAQTHQRFNCLLIDLKTYGIVYSNSQVITKFMEALPEYWETYTMCLKMSKDIKTITLSELYGMMLNHEQTKSLKTNLIRDTKDAMKGTSLALISDASQPSQTPVSTVTITEIDDSDSDLVSDNEADFNESLALLSKHFKKFGRKGNFRKGLIAEGRGWDESSDESFDEEDTSEVTCLMAIAEETEPTLMAQLEDIPEEEVTATSASTSDLP